jgi:single-strand DNA-binding protein
MNVFVGIGRLVSDPDLKYLQNGTAVCKFTIAIDRGMSKDKKEEVKSKGGQVADFIRIVVWGKLAETVANYLTKGKMAGISGRIQTGSYTDKDGKKVFTSDVVAQQVSFLEWGDKQDAGNSISDYDMDGFHATDESDIPF